MMQRKKALGGAGAVHSTSSAHDDGGSAKMKPSRPKIASRLQAVLPSSISKKKSKSAPYYCLPGVPVVLKLTLVSFVGFAVLAVFTSKSRHGHWRYTNPGIRSPHMPVPLRDRIKQGGLGESGRVSSSDASQKMLAKSSRFVDSEKKLKKQLLKLLENQKGEHKSRLDDPNKSVRGVKISNRYLGEDLLPYPNSKGEELKWEKKMEKRKAELTMIDEKEWNEMLSNYDEVMESHSHENDHEDHALISHADVDHGIDERNDSAMEGGENSGDAVAQSKGSKMWPPPSEKASAGVDTTILLKPAFGSHRFTQDAILIFAEGYDLSIYLAFVESLISTGYSGDLVISISNEEKLKPGVKEYLRSKNADTHGVNIVAYEVNWSCFKKDTGVAVAGSNEGISHCKMDNAFGDASGNPISDPREPRPVATARYELYWMWSLQYNEQSWLMLIDARDVWFQLHPFQDLKSRGRVSGELHLFGENADVVRIGTSNYNRSWLITAYGEKAASPYFEQPVICSGSTLGNQDAIETYLRAMVAEYDTTLCKSKGCDQGFHNYLYYSGKLGTVNSGSNVEGISKVIVHEQGKGIINNLGALRTKPLSEWGLYNAKKELVLNWDGTTSAVAHQYDRDKEANNMVKGKKRYFEQQWKASKY